MTKITGWIEKYVENLQTQGRSKNTIDAYKRTLLQFASWKNNDDVNTTSQELQDFFYELRIKRNLKPASLHQYEAAISSFYQFLYKQDDIIDKNPMDKVDRPKIKQNQPKIPHHEEVMDIIDRIAKMDTKYALIIRTIYATGMRISELCSLRIEDINFKENIIKICHGKGGKDRFVCCDAETLDEIKFYIGSRISGYVFVGNADGHISTHAVQKMFRKYAPSGITPHKIRHSFATELYKASHDLTAVQNSLGHSSIQTTQIYLHSDIEEMKKAYSSFPLQIQTQA